MASGFKITDGKGFHITFGNGYTVSVQWGYGNYCENRNDSFVDFNNYTKMQTELGKKGSETAEIAIWGADNEMLNVSEHDKVAGWVSPENLAWILRRVSTYEGSKEILEQEIQELLGDS